MGRPRRRTWHGFPPAHPRHGCSPDIRPGTDPAPRRGGGGAPQARAGWGSRRGIRVPCQRLGWDRREARWLERERQGRGNEFPLPASPTPNGDIPMVQCTGRSRRRTWHGFLLAHPRHGCSPDIRPGTAPAPPGGGGGTPQARAGWGLPAEEYGYPCGGAGGVGEPAKCMGIPLEGNAGAERMSNPPAKILARRRTGLCRTPPAGIYLNPVQKVHYYWLQIISCNG